MYLPAHFKQIDEAAVQALLNAYPLASLVSVIDGQPSAEHIPLRLRRKGDTTLLVGHVARANALWRHATADAGIAVLAIFHGPQSYVSPHWYPSKAVDGRAVPTWNYSVVHAHGRLRAVDDPIWLRELLTELSAEHESFQSQPWRIDDAPAEYIERQLQAIVGIELTVERLIGKFKLHQNHPEANRRGVIDGLENRGPAPGLAVAAQMREQLDTPNESRKG